MKALKKISQMILTFAVIAIMTTPNISMAADAPVDLGTAEGFALLAGQTITNTGTTTINGNVGISPGSSFTKGPAIINGTIHINDTIAIQAKKDLTTAFNDAAGRTPVITIPTELGGSTLKPGYYVSESGTFGLTGTLTLDGNGNSNAVFVFMTASSLITAKSSQVKLINGADDSQIFWKVGSSATLGIKSHFEGTIMALESITLTTEATVNGSLFARNGAVTLDTNTINTEILPLISIEKTADKMALSEGPDTVVYSYEVSNLGSSDLEKITVTDDKISDVTYVSGDTNADEILQPTEVWTYTASMMIDETTTNVVTVSASANDIVVVDTDTVTVTVAAVEAAIEETPIEETPDSTEIVTPEPTVIVFPEINVIDTPEPTDTITSEGTDTVTSETTTTVTPTPIVTPAPESTVAPTDDTLGGKLPKTATPLYLYLTGGIGFMLLGLLGLKINSKI